MYQPPTANHTANFVASVKKDFSKNRPQGKTSKYQGMKKPINSAQRKACTFCEGDHFSNDCTDVAEHEKRIAIIKKKRNCVLIVLETHRVSDCRTKYDCRICHRKHHTSICKKNTTHQSEDKDNTETSMLYTSASQETSTVLLKTAVAQENLRFRGNFGNWKSLGIDEKEVDTSLIDVMETFAESSITKQNGKYVSKLPWKENCPEFTNKQRDRQKKEQKM
ncbi:Hypothetical predicted protein [Mytilus galloprovincialis]|uniref:Uncharacterized protein n=1 Tax=Mytilus galloprovincialis TaxID=29158 RepID=A0A8B6C2F7_MYTGA|nr:Hypothetical predicted protein [Mytilus galloprovincialis]